MKTYKDSECVLGENYFFVYEGIVYYGTASQPDWDEDDSPTQFKTNAVDANELAKYIEDLIEAQEQS